MPYDERRRRRPPIPALSWNVPHASLPPEMQVWARGTPVSELIAIASGRRNIPSKEQLAARQLQEQERLAKSARRVYVGNIPPATTETVFLEFMSSAISRYRIFDGLEPADEASRAEGTGLAAQEWADEPQELAQDSDEYGRSMDRSRIVQILMYPEKFFAFVEFPSEEHVRRALLLDGVWFPNGNKLKFRKSSEAAAEEDREEAAAAATHAGPTSRDPALDSLRNFCRTEIPPKSGGDPYKLFIGGIPHEMTDASLEELLSTVGQLRALQIVRDTATNRPRGFAFAEYIDTADALRACEVLNGSEVKRRKLDVHLANGPAARSSSGPAATTPLARMDPVERLGTEFKPHDLRPEHILRTVLPLVRVVAAMLGDDSPSRFVCFPNCLPLSLPAAQQREAVEAFVRGLSEIASDAVSDQQEQQQQQRHQIVEGHVYVPPSDTQDVVGQLFVEFHSTHVARQAVTRLLGRSFMGLLVQNIYVPEETYERMKGNA